MEYILKLCGEDYYTNEKYMDASIRDFGRLKDIRKFSLTSKKMNLTGLSFDADLKFNNIESRGYLSNDQSWPIFSPKMMEVLADFNLSYNTYPVRLFGTDKKQLPASYTAIQIPRIENLVNLEQSLFQRKERFPKYFEYVQKLVFNLSGDVEQLFRINEKFDLVIVRNELKIALEKAQIPGIMFVPAEEYNNTILYS